MSGWRRRRDARAVAGGSGSSADRSLSALPAAGLWQRPRSDVARRRPALRRRETARQRWPRRSPPSKSSATCCRCDSPFAEYLQKEWLPAIEATVRETTFRSYAAHVAYHIVPALGSTQLQKLNGAMLNAFYAKLGSEGRVHGEGGLSPGTVRRVHATLHRALRDAVRWNRLSVNPADAADPPRCSAERRRAAGLEWRAAVLLPRERQGRSPLRPLALPRHDRLPAR